MNISTSCNCWSTLALPSTLPGSKAEIDAILEWVPGDGGDLQVKKREPRDIQSTILRPTLIMKEVQRGFRALKVREPLGCQLPKGNVTSRPEIDIQMVSKKSKATNS